MIAKWGTKLSSSSMNLYAPHKHSQVTMVEATQMKQIFGMTNCTKNAQEWVNHQE